MRLEEVIRRGRPESLFARCLLLLVLEGRVSICGETGSLAGLAQFLSDVGLATAVVGQLWIVLLT